ncbi:actin-like ATPase domain-containing protein [Auriscalpium vulgare]|uniref:Actin-like ATPase domain-containing protein n=1 Tax=Auriscalpium vulgare TaxID=40419 RepID=A0ACB8S965_9AGAM|nr:actin-like ATPase domain-containing protein [Auriscalpium vulgare]
MNTLCRRLSVLLFLSLFSSPVLAAVLAIDYGTDFMKASLVKPGVPFDVLLNKDSKRKIATSLTLKDTERVFGQDAYNLAPRFPSSTFNSLKFLVGAPANAAAVTYFDAISTTTLVATSRYTVGVPKHGKYTWDVEELIAMQLAYVRQLATDAAGEPVRDVIITVPPYFSQFERDAIADSVEIAGMRLLTLINDGTAVAVNYAMTRTFPEPERHIVYDVGASGTRATLVTFSGFGKKKDATQITVNGVGSDRLVGGTELTRRLRDILLEQFNNQHGDIDIKKDKKAMAKLWKEADRVKQVLSANTEARATIESLVEDIDFKAKVSRAEFEKASADIVDIFIQPIAEALYNAGLKLADVNSVILMGGSSRVPMLRTALATAVGEDKIAQNVNTDEAAVLGAALHGASLSRQFRTKDIKIADIIPHDVQVSYLAETKATGDGVRPRTITSTAFVSGSKTGTRKTLTFKRKDDFTLTFAYKEPPAGAFPVELLEARIAGIPEALANITASGGVDPIIKATILLSESGFVSVPEAFAYADIKDDSIAGKLKGFFGDASSTAEDGSTQTADAASSDAPKATNTATPDSITIPLNVTVKFTSIAPMSVEQKREARDRLIELEQKEAAKALREEQRNVLEGYLYRLRDLLDGDGDQPFIKCSTEKERTTLGWKLEEVSGWFHREEETADTQSFIEKRQYLERVVSLLHVCPTNACSHRSLEFPVMHRFIEIQEFPAALNNSQKWNWQTRLFLTEAKTVLAAEEQAGTEGKYTREELDALEKTLKEHEAWLNTNVEKQKARKMYEDPAVETQEMGERAERLERHLQRLVQKKPPKPRKTKASASSSTTPTESGSESRASGPSPSQTGAKGHDEL